MTVRLGDASDRKLLDPVELASRDEITALQTWRLAATLHTAYAHVPATRAKFSITPVIIPFFAAGITTDTMARVLEAPRAIAPSRRE